MQPEVRGTRDSISIVNHTDNVLLKAFGCREDGITVEKVNYLFGGRCFPRNRANCRELLNGLELDFYDPYLIVCKTHGVMACDPFWIRFLDEKEKGMSYNDARRDVMLEPIELITNISGYGGKLYESEKY